MEQTRCHECSLCFDNSYCCLDHLRERGGGAEADWHSCTKEYDATCIMSTQAIALDKDGNHIVAGSHVITPNKKYLIVRYIFNDAEKQAITAGGGLDSADLPIYNGIQTSENTKARLVSFDPWQCGICKYDNRLDNIECQSCNTERPDTCTDRQVGKYNMIELDVPVNMLRLDPCYKPIGLGGEHTRGVAPPPAPSDTRYSNTTLFRKTDRVVMRSTVPNCRERLIADASAQARGGLECIVTNVGEGVVDVARARTATSETILTDGLELLGVNEPSAVTFTTDTLTDFSKDLYRDFQELGIFRVVRTVHNDSLFSAIADQLHINCIGTHNQGLRIESHAGLRDVGITGGHAVVTPKTLEAAVAWYLTNVPPRGVPEMQPDKHLDRLKALSVCLECDVTVYMPAKRHITFTYAPVGGTVIIDVKPPLFVGFDGGETWCSLSHDCRAYFGSNYKELTKHILTSTRSLNAHLKYKENTNFQVHPEAHTDIPPNCTSFFGRGLKRRSSRVYLPWFKSVSSNHKDDYAGDIPYYVAIISPDRTYVCLDGDFTAQEQTLQFQQELVMSLEIKLGGTLRTLFRTVTTTNPVGHQLAGLQDVVDTGVEKTSASGGGDFKFYFKTPFPYIGGAYVRFPQDDRSLEATEETSEPIHYGVGLEVEIPFPKSNPKRVLEKYTSPEMMWNTILRDRFNVESCMDYTSISSFSRGHKDAAVLHSNALLKSLPRVDTLKVRLTDGLAGHDFEVTLPKSYPAGFLPDPAFYGEFTITIQSPVAQAFRYTHVANRRPKKKLGTFFGAHEMHGVVGGSLGGAVVTKVEPEGVAGGKLLRGDIITAINSANIGFIEPKSVDKLMNQQAAVLLSIRRPLAGAAELMNKLDKDSITYSWRGLIASRIDEPVGTGHYFGTGVPATDLNWEIPYYTGAFNGPLQAIRSPRIAPALARADKRGVLGPTTDKHVDYEFELRLVGGDGTQVIKRKPGMRRHTNGHLVPFLPNRSPPNALSIFDYVGAPDILGTVIPAPASWRGDRRDRRPDGHHEYSESEVDSKEMQDSRIKAIQRSQTKYPTVARNVLGRERRAKHTKCCMRVCASVGNIRNAFARMDTCDDIINCPFTDIMFIQ